MININRDWSSLRKLIWLRGNPATGGGGSPLTVSGPTPLLMPGALAKPLRKAEFQIIPVQAGSGDPSPSNVRPITGHSSMTATVRGKNMCPDKKVQKSANVVYFGTDSLDKYLIRLTKDVTYHVDFTLSAGMTPYDLYIKAEGDETTRGIGKTFTAQKTGMHQLAIVHSPSISVNDISDIMLTPGTTASPYTPYRSDSVSVTFPASVGTVYGGTFDPVTGQGVVTHKEVDLGELDWEYITNDGTPYYFRSTIYDRKNGALNIVASMLKTNTVSGTSNLQDCCIVGSSNGRYIYVRYDAYQDAEQFKTAIDGCMLLYELATPIPFTVPPQSLTPPAGDAYIWADCGSTAEVTYIGKP